METKLKIIHLLGQELKLKENQILNTLALLEGGGTIPFIARYRKEMTENLDEVQIRSIEDRFAYYRDLDDRKKVILKSIEEVGKLTPALKTQIEQCLVKQELEDLYLPYRPKRRTKAAIAREKGLEPLAQIIWAQEITKGSCEDIAAAFISEEKGVTSCKEALEGAQHILAEQIAEEASSRKHLREFIIEKGSLTSRAIDGAEAARSKYEMYYQYVEPIKGIPSHRLLAMRRGEKEGVLSLDLEAPLPEILAYLEGKVIGRKQSIFMPLLKNTILDAYQRLIKPTLTTEIRLWAKERADQIAIQVFSKNLETLLLSPPTGPVRIMGIDPGFRTGSKVAIIDETGKFLHYIAIYPLPPQEKKEEAEDILTNLIREFSIQFIAIGNGTASREIDQFVGDLLKKHSFSSIIKVMVNEAGASVYSASDLGREEFPDLDVTVRGAISIARRLQDPLSELVKIDPKSVGVGQYQHDVDQNLLKKSLDTEVESCVNRVGVEVNTASWPLLSYIAGIGPLLAKNIVNYKDQHGQFMCRQDLLSVPRMGPKAFEQSAGFLRIRNGRNPLDNSAVHPESYRLVEKIAQVHEVDVPALIGNTKLLSKIKLQDFVTDNVGLPTLQDIFRELEKPGRDPRKEFRLAQFQEHIRELADLREGMVIEGTITNVTHFGAFVDIGVHQDGLVHISELADKYINNPSSVISVGQIVNVKVLMVDIERKRISLSLKRVHQENNFLDKTA